MRIVIDANRIIAALIKDGTTRKILFERSFEFLAPDLTVFEVRSQKDRIVSATGLYDTELEEVMESVLARISPVPFAEYCGFIKECLTLTSDPGDVPYLATCMAKKAKGLWTHDPHFKGKKIRVLTNIDMLRLCGKCRA